MTSASLDPRQPACRGVRDPAPGGRGSGLREGKAEQTFGLSPAGTASTVDSDDSPRHKITKEFLLDADWGGSG